METRRIHLGQVEVEVVWDMEMQGRADKEKLRKQQCLTSPVAMSVIFPYNKLRVKEGWLLKNCIAKIGLRVSRASTPPLYWGRYYRCYRI